MPNKQRPVYGVPQWLIKGYRETIQDGELEHDEAMQRLSKQYHYLKEVFTGNK
ncbi:hypothetical protein Arno18_25 [Pectobacterium phage Arno18]|uniref:Uncharacterized protein n=1 Tax=Pectobacterium phage Arno18 TaxID=2500578 RepID=A0A678ZJW7_9CAUD|nr:hypothetical protein Arno18_25 [Pectobacterium phage Arno18]